MPLVVRQRLSGRLRGRYRADAEVVAWWGSLVECESAIDRLHREDRLAPRSALAARARARRFATTWHEIQPTEQLRESACRLLRVHALRAADALQLAAALAASEGFPRSLEFVCLDTRLAAAAELEGFPVVSG